MSTLRQFIVRNHCDNCTDDERQKPGLWLGETAAEALEAFKAASPHFDPAMEYRMAEFDPAKHRVIADEILLAPADHSAVPTAVSIYADGGLAVEFELRHMVEADHYDTPAMVSLPAKTPIEPVMVPGWATILSAAMAP